MSVSINKHIVMGYAATDADIRFTTSGNGVTNVTVYTSESFQDQTGNWIEQSEKHRIVFWDRGNYKLAQRAAESIKKGTLIHIEGPSKTRVWEKEGGEKVYYKEIHAENLIVIKQPEQQANQHAQQQQPKPLPHSSQQPAANPNVVGRFGSWD